jgi:transposase-like protein
MYAKQTHDRKSKRQLWSHENIKRLIVEAMKGAMSYMKASKEFGVPNNTLRARLQKYRKWLTPEDAFTKSTLR